VAVGFGTGVTTGNSEFKLLGFTVGPGMTSGNGGEATGGDGLGDEFTAPIAAVIDASAGESPAPWTVTFSVISSLTVAFAPILSVT
jgi:hypothetical protein